MHSQSTIVIMKKAEKKIEENFSSQPIKIFNPYCLFDIGRINHFIISKSGTLTTGEVKIGALSTISKIYKIQVTKLSRQMQEVKKNPDKYMALEDDSFDEDEKYSEKSQEYLREIRGEYLPEIFDEDEDFSDIMNDSGLERFRLIGSEFTNDEASNGKGSSVFVGEESQEKRPVVNGFSAMANLKTRLSESVKKI